MYQDKQNAIMHEPSVRSFISSKSKSKGKGRYQLEVDCDNEEQLSMNMNMNLPAKKMGRPRKNPENANDTVSEQPKKRGRPKKHQ